eukprot:TRINITY_DN1443_c0_g1_i1.p1 TRINITY_DN1443_c0_g1~~TRINITY_DN1443_c0_g1_i1.p1  ORF type:complete len:492 (+),score=101.08 TRINITY_DN1443_c0_g1_i1:210-1478(+)
MNNSLCLNCNKYPKANHNQFCSEKCYQIFDRHQNNLITNIEYNNNIDTMITNIFPNNNMCLNCKVKQANQGYQYCSRTCGIKHNSNNNIIQNNNNNNNYISSNNNMCLNCKVKQANQGYQYCSRTCGIKHNSNNNIIQNNNNNNNYISSNNNMCLNCKVKQANKGYQYCSRTCGIKHNSNNNIIQNNNNISTHISTPNKKKISFINLQTNDLQKYREIENQFYSKWLHNNKPKPKKILSILKVIVSGTLEQTHEDYKKKVINNNPNLKLFNKATPGNTVRRFHGTQLACKLHLTESLCSNTNCLMCSICEKGFLLKYSGTGPLKSNNIGQRFGDGIYFTSCSSKAHDYSSNTEQYLGVGVRALLLCYVVVGNGEKRTQDDKSPPKHGYDSILGEVGGNLNYDEVTVFHEGSGLPAYVLIYQN